MHVHLHHPFLLVLLIELIIVGFLSHKALNDNNNMDRGWIVPLILAIVAFGVVDAIWGLCLLFVSTFSF